MNYLIRIIASIEPDPPKSGQVVALKHVSLEDVSGAISVYRLLRPKGVATVWRDEDFARFPFFNPHGRHSDPITKPDAYDGYLLAHRPGAVTGGPQAYGSYFSAVKAAIFPTSQNIDDTDSDRP